VDVQISKYADVQMGEMAAQMLHAVCSSSNL